MDIATQTVLMVSLITVIGTIMARLTRIERKLGISIKSEKSGRDLLKELAILILMVIFGSLVGYISITYLSKT